MLENQICRRARRALALLTAVPLAVAGDWLQWGGPDRKFMPPASGLAPKWPEAGPKQLWTRDLGPGHSAIAAEKGVLYTMYRKGDQDVVIAMNAADGKTIWETAYDAPAKADMLLD